MTNRSVRIAGAPISWGVCEVPGWGHQLSTDRVLSEMARAGLTATELGPAGFLPEEPLRIRERLAEYGLRLVGGFVPAVLHRADVLRAQLAAVERAAASLAEAGGEVLVLAAETGLAGYERSVALGDDEWRTLLSSLDRAAALARSNDLVLAFHPHYGTVIEKPAEIHRLLEESPVGLCLDTGHLLVGGGDPVAIARSAASRIVHVHLKDVSAAIAARVRSREIGYRDAVREGLYRPLGEGDVDLVAVIALLKRSGYAGWFVIEQDAVLDPTDGEDLVAGASRSVRHLSWLMTRSAA